MKKHLLLALVLQFIGLFGYAQTAMVTGTIIDEKDQEPLIGAHVFLKSEGVNVQSVISNIDGTFLLENVAFGNYELAFSYIGYESSSRTIEVREASVKLGILKLNKGVGLEEIQVVDKVLPVIQLDDTTQFNANSYKTMPDADASELIEKMPTVVVDQGTVQAQGEDVKQVLVDGKPFFGNDPTAALKNIPAEIIDKIQIYDQQSDQAKFTGFDDGESSKTINIITKSNMRAGQFGKIYGGYGYDNKYKAGGNINIFNGDQRISLIGLSNNINIQNFSAEDLLGVVGTTGGRRGGRGGGRGRGGRGGGRGQSGVSSSDFLVSQTGGVTAANAFGINFSDKWGKKLDVSASYFFNQSDNTTEQTLLQQYFDEAGLTEIYSEESLTESSNLNHRFAGVFNYKINKNNSLILRSNASWQGNDGTENVFGQTLIDTDVLDQTESDFAADLSAFNLTNALLWRHSFEKRGRTFSMNVSNGLAPKDGESFLLSDNSFETITSRLNQFSTLDNHTWNIGTNVQYTEPVSDKSQVSVDYRASYKQEESTKETFDFVDATEDFDLFNEDLSNVFSNDYFTQSAGAGYRHRAGKLGIMARARVQWSELTTEQSLPFQATTDNDFFNVLPMVSLSLRKSRMENLRLMYRTSTNLPNIEQLQNVVNNSNPLQLTIGNPNLLQAYQHNLIFRYSKTNTEKSSVLFAMLRGSYTNNYIASKTFFSAADFDVNLGKDVQLTVPVNLDGYYSLQTLVTYGFPVVAIKSNLNVDFTANHTQTPGLVEEALNEANNSNVGIGLTLSSNINERVDFTVSSRSNLNFVTNTLQPESNTKFINQRTKVKFNWIVGKGLVFRTNLTHDFYAGLADDFDQNYLLWSLSIGKKIFKNDRGEISLTVFDLLNQNNAVTRNVTEIYIEDVQTNVLQRYVMLSFKYDLRNFKLK